MRIKPSLIAAMMFMAFVVIHGCATINLDTQEKKYLAVRAELNILLNEYLPIQDKISDEDHAKIKAAFQSADLALDTWEGMLGTEYDYSQDLRVWLQAKNLIVSILKKYAGEGN